MPDGPLRFEDLLEAAPDAMVGVDAAGCAVFANARAKTLLGRDPVGAALGPLPASLTVTRSPMGELELLVMRPAEPAVEQLRAALDNSPSVIYLKDPEGRYLLVNRAFARLHARPPDELVGRLDREQLAPEVAERMRIDDLRVMSSREPIEIQEEVTHGDETRTFLSVKFPLLDGDGALYGVGGVATDITHHLRLEARLRDAQRLEAVGQLAGGVAHDFNNLIAVIANYAAFVRKELPDGSRAAGDADQILAASRRASDLTRRLLLFSRRRSGTPEVLSIRRVIEGVETVLRQTLGADVELHVHCDQRLWEVEADRNQLEQVLMNLTLNAREAMPEGGRLRIEAHNDVMRTDTDSSRAVRLEVTDSGRGMAREVIAHAFEPFFTTKPAGGIGLGLATVHGIVTKAGGRVGLVSEPGRGTTVTVWLPAARRGAPAYRPPSGAPRGRGETALVVEDADAVRVLTGRILYSAGYQVIPVENGAVALERLDGADVLVTDVVMPGMSGVELATAARELRPGLPVVFVSGYTGNETIASPSDPATAFLAKPFDGDDLLRAVRATLDGAARTRAAHS
ncbi:ATP-binding protein [Candidatus Solirubrobacter pratensis]|uniref:ATP-binding protein n=1 Tax=Candidatus Solirubrobacter pratensis TaxID=1298857 RepID=UPI000420E957|nr:ATP-binding protein [Candidatus Solirubrobacter pratensis]